VSALPHPQGRYRFVRTLGAGRFGEVVCAEHLGPAGFRRLVALKRPHADDPQAVERLLREARVGALVRHPNVVATEDVGRDDLGWFLVLEYVDGPTLWSILTDLQERRRALDPGAALGLARQLCAALAYAHDLRGEDGEPLGLVHGDLSPGNVLISRRGQVKVTDFGAARTALTREAPGGARGTPGFAAPEALAGAPLDARADVFSLGAILRRIVSLTDLAQHPGLVALVERATASEPSARFPHAGALLDALDALGLAPGSHAPLLPQVAEEWTAALATLAEEVQSSSQPPLLPARPYRGLEAFGPESAALFFGRQDDTHRLALRVRQRPIVVLTGASGAGKSSLLAAGLPALLPDLATLSLRPGADPVGRLARAAALSREAVSALARGAAEPPLPAPSLLVVDQAEELLTLASAEDRHTTLAALVALAEAGAARVLLSVRADYLAPLCDLEPLRDRVTGGVELLALPGREQLREALVRPLEPFGFRFESPALVDRIVSALVGQPGALALMQFCADRLWESRDRDGGLLREADYEAMGGVTGALTTYADRVLAELLPAEREVARRVLLRCLRGGTRSPTALTELVEAPWAGEHGARVVERLVSARLLTRRLDPESGPVVEPAHEALAEHWHALTNWVTQDALAHRLLDDLTHAAARWEKMGRSPDLLWSRDLLAEWRHLGAELDEHLGPTERAFLEASVAWAQRRRRRRLVTVAAIMTALALLVALATAAWRRAEDAHVRAEAARARAELASELQRASAARERGEIGRAVALARGVLRAYPGDHGALAELYASVGGRHELAVLSGHEDTVRDGVFSPDGRYILTVDMHGAARLWDTRGALVRVVQAESGPLYFARFHPSADRFLTVGVRDGVAIWSTDGALERKIQRPGRVIWASWDSTGERLLACDVKGGVAVYDAAGAQLGAVRVAAGSIPLGGFAPDGSRAVVTGLHDDTSLLLSRDGAVLATLPTGGEGMHAAISARGRALVASWGGAVEVFGPRGERLGALQGRSRYPVARWSPTGDLLAAGAPDQPGGVVLATPSGHIERPLSPHRASVVALAFNPAGDRLATASEDGEIRLHDPRDGRLVAVLRGHRKRIWALAWSPDGERLLSTSEDRTARLWDANGRAPGRLAVGEPVEWCPVDPQGTRVLTLSADVGDDEVLTLYDLRGRRVKRWEARGPAAVVAARWRPDGAVVALVQANGALTLRDRDGEVLPPVGLTRAVRTIAWAGDALVAGTRDGALERPGVEPLPLGLGPVALVAALSPQRGAATDRARAVVYDLPGRRATALPGAARVTDLCWSPDGERLVGVGQEAAVWLWDGDGALVETLAGHRERVAACAWHPGGQRFATAAWDGTVRVWSRGGETLEVIEGHGREIQDVSWSPDGTRLLMEGWDGTATLRDDRGILATLRGHGGEVMRAHWVRGGRRVVTCARGGEEVHVWPGTDEEVMRWAEWLLPSTTSPR